jgi:uncharacterized protein YjbI with pentapeptide repeats
MHVEDLFVTDSKFEKIIAPNARLGISEGAFADATIGTIEFSHCTSLAESPIADGSFKEATIGTIGTVDFSGSTRILNIRGNAFKGVDIDTIDFSKCTNLYTSTCIGGEAFTNARIGTVNFSGCTSLQTLPMDWFRDATITRIDFLGCTNLQKISTNSFRNTKIDFSRCNKLWIDEFAFVFATIKESIIFPTTLTSIAPYAFRNTTFCYTLDFSQSNLKTIAENAFKGSVIKGCLIFPTRSDRTPLLTRHSTLSI